MNKFANLLRTHKFLSFFSSVRLAVPLMVTIGLVVAIGTVYESMYNSEYAKILIYHTSWFFALMSLLWINICFAMLSRWPFKKQHLGFVVTHIGMMILLIGGFITGFAGIDGQLRVTEGDASSTVILGTPIIGYQFKDSPNAQMIDFPRKLSTFSANQDSSLNSEIKSMFWVANYLPFATSIRSIKENSGDPGSVALSFRLKSQFFDVSEWLDSATNPTMKMGPATIELKVGIPESQSIINKAKSTRQPQATNAKTTSAADTLEIIDSKSGKILGKKSVAELTKKAWEINGISIQVKKVYRQAVVSANKLTEGDGSSANPAIELEVISEGKTQREVLFSRFKGFSLNKEGLFGLKIQIAGNTSLADLPNVDPPNNENALPPGHPPMDNNSSTEAMPSSPAAAAMAGGNIIQFWVDPSNKSKSSTIILIKGGAEVGRTILAEGEQYQTPWMGMVLTLASVVQGGRPELTATPVQPQKGGDLPPSAVEIQLTGENKRFWLLEGSSQDVDLMGRPAQIFYGRRVFDLPFAIQLIKFTKVDYPGTETAMSYESQVEVNGLPAPIVISMNEPLKKGGYTIYQSSYVLQPNRPPESIFSVNKDPGRPVKYAGSIILALGIIIFTTMRSRWWTKRIAK